MTTISYLHDIPTSQVPGGSVLLRATITYPIPPSKEWKLELRALGGKSEYRHSLTRTDFKLLLPLTYRQSEDMFLHAFESPPWKYKDLHTGVISDMTFICGFFRDSSVMQLMVMQTVYEDVGNSRTTSTLVGLGLRGERCDSHLVPEGLVAYAWARRACADWRYQHANHEMALKELDSAARNLRKRADEIDYLNHRIVGLRRLVEAYRGRRRGITYG